MKCLPKRKSKTVIYPMQTDTSGILEIHYCEAFAPWFAKAVAKDYMDYYTLLSEPEVIALPDLGVDYAAAFCDRSGSSRVVLAEGSTVVCALFTMDDENGYFTLENWAKMMAQQLLGRAAEAVNYRVI